MPHLLKSLDNDDSIEFTERAAEGGERLASALSALKGKGGDGDDDDDDDDDDDEKQLSIRTALLDEKAAAAHCIGECAKHAGAGFAPHVERCLQSLLNAADYFHEDVRGAVAHALGHLLVPCAAAEPPAQPWVKGGPRDESLLG
eukprot:4512978-Prymnesium_polylepis.1